LIIDNLPCATQFTMPDTMEVQYEPGMVINPFAYLTFSQTLKKTSLY
jgi:hypothetical protein